MSDTSSVSSTLTSTSASTGTSASSLTQVSTTQTDFLTLLTAQLETQDPFDPVDNADLVAQLATISNTTGIAEMNQSISEMTASMASIEGLLSTSRLGDAASWIGRTMLVESDHAAPNAAGDYSGQITLTDASDDVTVSLVDGDGNTVKTIALGAQAKGDVSFYWDGYDDAGNYVAGDTYKVKVSGAETSSIATWASIAAVQSPADSSASRLITPLGTFSPTDALKLL